MQGFVWEVDGRIVGNLTIIPFMREGGWQFLIANVATNPSYRRQGIARKLTQAGLDYIREHGGKYAWLQVREENKSAYDLYVSQGFREVTRRTTYRRSRGITGASRPAATSTLHTAGQPTGPAKKPGCRLPIHRRSPGICPSVSGIFNPVSGLT